METSSAIPLEVRERFNALVDSIEHVKLMQMTNTTTGEVSSVLAIQHNDPDGLGATFDLVAQMQEGPDVLVPFWGSEPKQRMN